MTYLAHAPSPPLADLIHFFWHHEENAPAHGRERVFPTGTMQLVFSLTDHPFHVFDSTDTSKVRTYRDVLVNGPRTTFTDIGTASLCATMGVHFKPGGALPFFAVPANDLENQNIPLDSLWGSEANEVADRIREARTPDERFRLLDAFLLAHVTSSVGHHPAIAFGLEQFRRQPFSLSIATVTDGTGLSHRRFNELFQAQVGMTLKLYQRVRRFQHLIRVIDGQPNVNWASVAAACGYADQSHMIRDMRDLGDVSPTEYLIQRGEYPNHVELHS